MKRFIGICFGMILLVLAAVAGRANEPGEGESPTVKVNGLVFGDFFWYADSHDPAYRNEFGFWIRRIYLGVDADLTHGFSSRLRFEMNQPDTNATSDKMYPFVKDVWLKYSFAGQNVMFGIQPPPSFALVESWWGYRWIEKTLTDLQKAESSRDLGVSMDGNITRNGGLRYALMYGNGNSTKSETDLAKAVYGALQFYPVDGFVIELFGKYAGMDGTGDWTTAGQAFLGYRNQGFSIGAQWYMNFYNGGSTTWMAASLFADVALGDKWALFLRGDYMLNGTYDGKGGTIPYLSFDDNADSQLLLIVGADYNPWGDIHLSPNLEYVFNFGDTAGRNEAVLRTTAFWKF